MSAKAAKRPDGNAKSRYADRTSVFERVRRLNEIHDHLTAAELKPGFLFRGERVPLVNPQRGIFQPQQMRFLLSIKTVFPKPLQANYRRDQASSLRWRPTETVAQPVVYENPLRSGIGKIPQIIGSRLDYLECDPEGVALAFMLVTGGCFSSPVSAVFAFSVSTKFRIPLRPLRKSKFSGCA